MNVIKTKMTKHTLPFNKQVGLIHGGFDIETLKQFAMSMHKTGSVSKKGNAIEVVTSRCIYTYYAYTTKIKVVKQDSKGVITRYFYDVC